MASNCSVPSDSVNKSSVKEQVAKWTLFCSSRAYRRIEKEHNEKESNEEEQNDKTGKLIEKFTNKQKLWIGFCFFVDVLIWIGITLLIMFVGIPCVFIIFVILVIIVIIIIVIIIIIIVLIVVIFLIGLFIFSFVIFVLCVAFSILCIVTFGAPIWLFACCLICCICAATAADYKLGKL